MLQTFKQTCLWCLKKNHKEKLILKYFISISQKAIVFAVHMPFKSVLVICKNISLKYKENKLLFPLQMKQTTLHILCLSIHTHAHTHAYNIQIPIWRQVFYNLKCYHSQFRHLWIYIVLYIFTVFKIQRLTHYKYLQYTAFPN